MRGRCELCGACQLQLGALLDVLGVAATDGERRGSAGFGIAAEACIEAANLEARRQCVVRVGERAEREAMPSVNSGLTYQPS